MFTNTNVRKSRFRLWLATALAAILAVMALTAAPANADEHDPPRVEQPAHSPECSNVLSDDDQTPVDDPVLTFTLDVYGGFVYSLEFNDVFQRELDTTDLGPDEFRSWSFDLFPESVDQTDKVAVYVAGEEVFSHTFQTGDCIEEFEQTCEVVVTYLVDRPDSAVGGGIWALDTMVREATVCEIAPGLYGGEVVDFGTFVTLELDHTPNGADQPLPAGIEGTIVGGFRLIEFEAAPGFATFDPSVLDGATVVGADHPSSTWVTEMFSDVTGSTLNGSAWGWVYDTCTTTDVDGLTVYLPGHEQWINQAGGNVGDITGLDCGDGTDPGDEPSKPGNGNPSSNAKGVNDHPGKGNGAENHNKRGW